MPEGIDRTDQLRQFVEAMRVERVGFNRFTAVPPDCWEPRLLGGMVVALSLNAALQTVDSTFQPHSMHGYFVRPGAPLVPSSLSVELVRDSRSFVLREVVMEQEDKETARFLCSFHIEENGDEYQLSMPEVPRPDSLHIGAMSLPFDVCDVGPTEPEADGTYRSTGRLWYRTSGPLGDDPELHTCMLALFSDMTRTSFRPLSLDSWGAHTDASIDHAVWFHRPARADDWFLSDFQAVVNTRGRSLVRGATYTGTGVLCMSMTQELLIRPLPGSGSPTPRRDASRAE